MQLHIGNLSAEITSQDLVQFFKGYGDKPSFTIKHYQKGRQRCYYALTSIVSESLASQAITALNMKRIKGRFIALHPYQDRIVNNERRALHWRSEPWVLEERRKTDRRHFQPFKRSGETINSVAPVPTHI